MAVHFHESDLPADVAFADGPIAIDTEAMGLYPHRDRLCLVQLSDGKGDESGATDEPARHASPQSNDRAGLRKFLLVTILCGTAFLGMQAYEWTHLIQEEYARSRR